jgi:ParB/RepB/Spo0J family partition protein
MSHEETSSHVQYERLKNSILRGENDGEEITDSLQAMRIPIEQIKDDHNFNNIRQIADREKIEKLKEDIKTNGLKTPIVVRASDASLDAETIFWARAGFRRLAAVRELGWDKIPAVVIPATAPELDDYWINLSENCQREKVTPYEIACQARILIARYGAHPRDIAKRSGVTEDRLRMWIRFVQNIPDIILEAWKAEHPFLTDRALHKYLTMSPWTATRQWEVDQGKMPRDPSFILAKRRQLRKIKVMPFEAMQELHNILGVARVSDEARRLALTCVEICMGARRVIPGVWPKRPGLRIGGRKIQPEELDLPDQDLGIDDVLPPTERNGKNPFVMVDEETKPMQSRTAKEKNQSHARAVRVTSK